MRTTLSDRVAFAASHVRLPGYDPQQPPEPMDQERFIRERLEQLGIFDEGDLELLLSQDTREGDARRVFCEVDPKLSVPRFRRVWGILREGSNQEPCSPPTTPYPDTTPSGMKDLVDAVRSIGQLSDTELLDRYGVDCSTEVEDELRKRTKGRNCIVFLKNEPGEPHRTISAKLIKEARRRHVGVSYHDGNTVYRVYPVGEFPELVYNKCPVTGDLLLDGYSEKLGVKWTIDYDALVFVHLVHKSGVEINAVSAREIQRVCADEGMDGLRSMFPAVAATYDDLKSIGELPSLLSRTGGTTGVQDPFGGKSGVRY